jgi:hypothetical protein
MLRSRIFYLPVIVFSYLFSLQTTIVSAADHPIFQPITGYGVATDEKGPGIASFARSSGKDIDVQGEKTVIRYELNSGTKEPGVSEIINRYSKIASEREGWTCLYTDRTLYMGFTEQGGREYFAEVYIGDEYYDLIVVERGASGTTTGGVTAQQTSNASKIQQAGISQPTVQQAQKQPVEAAGSSSIVPEGLEAAHPEGTEGAGGQSSGGGSSAPASIQIVAPEPDAILFAGEQTNVRWTTTGVVGAFVEIGYGWATSPSSMGFQSLARNVPSSSGGYRVTMPASLNSRNATYRLIVRSDRPPYRSES